MTPAQFNSARLQGAINLAWPGDHANTKPERESGTARETRGIPRQARDRSLIGYSDAGVGYEAQAPMPEGARSTARGWQQRMRVGNAVSGGVVVGPQPRAPEGISSDSVAIGKVASDTVSSKYTDKTA